MRKRQIQTRYVSDYGYNINRRSLKQGPSILLYKKLSEMEYASFLTNQVIASLDQWVALKDTEWQEPILNTLRSMNSRFRVHAQHETEYKYLPFPLLLLKNQKRSFQWAARGLAPIEANQRQQSGPGPVRGQALPYGLRTFRNRKQQTQTGPSKL